MAMKIHLKAPDRHKYTSVRNGNDLTKIKRWMKWAKKNYPGQRFILVNNYKAKMLSAKDKKTRDYWKVRFKGGHEDKYIVYGSY